MADKKRLAVCFSYKETTIVMIRFNKEIQGSRDSDNYATPKSLYDRLNAEFNFDFDPCPLRSEFDGLGISWHGSIYINPPYSNIAPFISKGIRELKSGNAKVCVYLLPARSDTKYWHNMILPFADEIRFVKGRICFNESKSPAPFPCALIVMHTDLSGNCKISSY